MFLVTNVYCVIKCSRKWKAVRSVSTQRFITQMSKSQIVRLTEKNQTHYQLNEAEIDFSHKTKVRIVGIKLKDQALFRFLWSSTPIRRKTRRTPSLKSQNSGAPNWLLSYASGTNFTTRNSDRDTYKKMKNDKKTHTQMRDRQKTREFKKCTKNYNFLLFSSPLTLVTAPELYIYLILRQKHRKMEQGKSKDENWIQRSINDCLCSFI